MTQLRTLVTERYSTRSASIKGTTTTNQIFKFGSGIWSTYVLLYYAQHGTNDVYIRYA